MKRYRQFYCQYSITVGLFCVLHYLYGFFPIKNASNIFSSEYDLPTSLQNVKFNRDKLYNSSVTKTVLIVIDAIRVDFVSSKNMPYTAGVIASGGGCQATARVASPTVTMPRIKAIVTGSVSGFIDVILNLGTAELMSDNIVQQFTQTRRAVFFGDDTWIKLFPQQFVRTDGTSSFFVNDYTEVDNNVTRHLDQELETNDWDLMILHYLGVDHIGHIEGPKSSLMPSKLKEMDLIIKRIHKYLLKQDRGMLVVCGDHGMKDSGSHGGVSLPELLVPVVVLGLPCAIQPIQEIHQVDLAPTLSALWGSPIPADSIGVVQPSMLTHLSPAQKLYAQLHNAQQLSKNFLRNGGQVSHEGYKKYTEARAKHHQWLVNSTTSHEEVQVLYHESLTIMSRFLSEILVNYHMPALFSSLAVLFQVLCIIGLRVAGDQSSLTSQDLLTTLVTTMLVGLLVIISQPSTSQLALVSSGLFFTFNVLVIYRQLQYLPILFKNFQMSPVALSWNQIIIPVGTALFCISLFSSSLIEEEHQIWYFLWATVILLRLLENPIQWFILLVCQRFLRKLNSTGDKWAHLPDISDWLIKADQRPLLSAVCGASLLAVVLCCTKVDRGRVSMVLYMIAGLFIYQHKASVQHVLSILPFWQSNSGVWEARVCLWLLLFALLLGRSLRSLVACWMLLVCLLLRPYNTLLVPTLFLTSRTVSSATSTSSTVLHLWIGSVFYFYQGNSNSLASVDLAAGYAGMEDYSLLLVAGLLYVHTYAMPVLAYLFHVYTLVEGNRKWEPKLTHCTETMVFMQILHLFTSLIMMTLQRYHLFVWTVFAPKLLYVGNQTLMCFFIISITNLCMYCAKFRRKNLHI